MEEVSVVAGWMVAGSISQKVRAEFSGAVEYPQFSIH